MRWGIDGRSYTISKSQGISKMVLGFKDYSKRGMGLVMSENELAEVNAARAGNSLEASDSRPNNCSQPKQR